MTDKANIFICGDIINQSSNEQFIDQSLIELIKRCDYSICNFEGNCTSETFSIGASQMLQHPSTLYSLKEAGFDLLLLANNHITDYGLNGLKHTIDQIDKYGFEHMGAGIEYESVYRPFILNIKGIKIGLINLCEAQLGHFKEKDQKYGYAWIGDFDIDERIRSLKREVDYIILIPHAGLENYPIPLKQFRLLYRHWCDIGVDVIVGGHPHISQGIECYKKSIIFYSLGNFFFSGINENIESWTKGISCILHFSDSGVTYDIVQHKMKGHKVYRENNDINQIAEKNIVLSDNNFYNSKLKEQNTVAFKTLPYRLYMSALNGTSSHDSILTKFKKIIYYLCNKNKLYAGSERYRMSVLKRLTENETYRFLTISAIEEQLGENYQRL